MIYRGCGVIHILIVIFLEVNLTFLKCIICKGEVEIIGNIFGTHKKTRCLSCGHTNESRQADIEVIRKKISKNNDQDFE